MMYSSPWPHDKLNIPEGKICAFILEYMFISPGIFMLICFLVKVRLSNIALELHFAGGVVCGGLAVQDLVGFGGEPVKLLPKTTLLRRRAGGMFSILPLC